MAELCSDHRDRIAFVQENVLRFRSEPRFGLVWSAGVMDYLDDRTSVHFLRVALRAACVSAEIVFGNFGPDNPTRPMMEVLGRWYLHHRSPRELFALAQGAGLPLEHVRLGMENEGINLFLHANKAAPT
jgi:hypothetical protein